MIKVSISLITYNHEKYISQAIESVLSQKTDFPFELVISDDASTDSTGSITEDYASRYPDIIRLCNREHNLGLVKNALQTISDCKGEYIALLEGDDYWVDNDKLQRQADFLDEKTDCAFCYTNGLKFWENSERQELSVKEFVPEKYNLKYFLEHQVPLLNNTKMFRRSVHPERFDDWFYDTVQWDWSLHVLHARFGMIGYLDFVSLNYRRHENAFIVSTNKIKLLESGLITMKNLNQELSYEYDFFFSQTWWHYEQLALEYLRSGNVGRFLINLTRAIYQHPSRDFKSYKDLLWKIRQVRKR